MLLHYSIYLGLLVPQFTDEWAAVAVVLHLQLGVALPLLAAGLGHAHAVHLVMVELDLLRSLGMPVR